MNIENEKIISNKHKILFGVGIILIALVIVGGTFAFLIFDVDVFNKNISDCDILITDTEKVLRINENDDLVSSPAQLLD